MGKRGRRHKHANKPEQWERKPASQNHAQPGNLYDSLRGGGDISDEERNAHLQERFGGSSRFPGSSSTPSNIPTSVTPRPNNDIRDYVELAWKPVPGADAWLKMPELPSSSEILGVATGCESSFGETDESLVNLERPIQRQLVIGPYDDKQDYLRIEYELLREDAIRPLREAIQEVRASPWNDEAEYKNHSIGIYEPVYIKSLVFSPRGIATRVAFSLSRVKKHIRWGQSKRLVTGSLVALSPMEDAFRTTCILATVAARPISGLAQSPPEIDLFFSHSDQHIDPMKKWLMIECRSSFFEASRHTMLALQHMMREPFPLSEYLVKAQKTVKPPAYVRSNPFTDLRSLVSVEDSADFKNANILEEWPSKGLHSLDESQSKALKSMLTSELALVQGPPGTGKTFVSVKLLQVLLDNLKAGDPPLLVTAQTNHAVDQLLRHVQAFEPNFIRLGGRSKDEEVKKRTLYEVRTSLPSQKQAGSQKVQGIKAMKILTSRSQMLLQPLEATGTPLDHRVLLELGIITKDQADSLDAESGPMMGMSADNTPGIMMEQWLGRFIAVCQRPVLPDDFDGGWEEEEFEAEQLHEIEAEAVAQDDDDIEALRGEVIQLSDNFVGKGHSSLTPVDIEKLLAETSDLTTIRNSDRGAIYNYFMRKTKESILLGFRKIAQDYEKAALQRQVGRWEEDVRILRDARIIGMTTTGLSKYRALMTALHPRVIMVEEAAETMEAPVTVACIPSLEHLILVGDHQQLRPHTQVREFEDEPYYLNLSLFERLVCNDVSYDTLTRQRRMIPEVRRLLHPIYDNTLKDHASVEDSSNRPSVLGMGGTDSFFFSHEWPEAQDAYMSCVNPAEAKFIAGFFEYLKFNGEDPYKITVLTFYNGQRKRILSELRARDELRGYPNLKVVTVDSYQGEENDIVLLSLVRSNNRDKIGFLTSENRACVALSRAKRGFYLFGNGELLARETRVWAAVAKIMWGKNEKGKDNKKYKTGQTWRLGFHFPLVCSKHGNKIWIETAEDWDSTKGGCLEKCEGKLPCGHKCPYSCHPFDHEEMNCRQPCKRPVEGCGHPCSATCGSTCKCDICERRSGGKAILKARPNGAGSSRPPPGGRQTLLLHHVSQTPSNPMPVSRTSDNHSSGSEAWEAFRNGGALADDVRILRERREQEAEFLASLPLDSASADPPATTAKLVEVSPQKINVHSKNTGLLLELGLDECRMPPQEELSPKGKGNGAQTPAFNLLD